MATRQEVIHRVQEIANNPAEDLQGLNKQVRMLARIMLALEKHYGKREKTLDLLAKKIHELVGAVNSFQGSGKTISSKRAASDTSELVATLRLKPIQPSG